MCVSARPWKGGHTSLPLCFGGAFYFLVKVKDDYVYVQYLATMIMYWSRAIMYMYLPRLGVEGTPLGLSGVFSQGLLRIYLV